MSGKNCENKMTEMDSSNCSNVSENSAKNRNGYNSGEGCCTDRAKNNAKNSSKNSANGESNRSKN